MKKQFKKLSLNKRTISNLDATEMKKYQGGDKTNGNGNTCTKCITIFCSFTCLPGCGASCGSPGGSCTTG